MHPAIRTLMRPECPCCDEHKAVGAIFCDICLALLADFNGGLYIKLRNATGRVYDDIWMEARSEILKSREHVAVYGIQRRRI